MPPTSRDPPHVTVVIPVRNGAADLARCLASLARQDFRQEQWDCIVVDNGSTDGTAAVAVEAGVTVLSCPGLRVGALRNRGVDRATGDVIAFVDADHEVPPDWIRQGVQSLDDHGPRAIVGAHYLAPPDGTWVQTTWELHRLREQGRTHETAWLGTGNLFLRRDDFRSIGGFREDLIATEDVDLCTRFVQSGGKVLVVPEIRNIHHGEPKTVREFFRKEFVRGKTGLRGFLANGLPRGEWPSIAYAMFHLSGLLLVGVAIVMSVAYVLAWPVPAALTVLAAPSILMAFGTCRGNNLPRIPLLASLYLLYGIARALALFRW